MRAIWKGSISFGLVNIPIALVPAVRKEAVKFSLLRKTDLSPVSYKRVAEADGQEVPWDQIVKGQEVINAPQDEPVGKREMEMAKSLVASMSSDWEPQAYKDEYQARLIQWIEEKVRTGAKEIGGKTTTNKPTTNVVDLLTVLQKSIAEASSKAKGKKAVSEKRKVKAAEIPVLGMRTMKQEETSNGAVTNF